MVLGYLLYEVVDLGVNVLKITYNGTKSAYYWWYSIDTTEGEKYNTKNVEVLTHRIEELERMLEDKKVSD